MIRSAPCPVTVAPGLRETGCWLVFWGVVPWSGLYAGPSNALEQTGAANLK